MGKSWADADYCYIEIPTCRDPDCRSPEYMRVRSEAAGDGSRIKKVVCTKCGEKYKILLELPDSGSVNY